MRKIHLFARKTLSFVFASCFSNSFKSLGISHTQNNRCWAAKDNEMWNEYHVNVMLTISHYCVAVTTGQFRIFAFVDFTLKRAKRTGGKKEVSAVWWMKPKLSTFVLFNFVKIVVAVEWIVCVYICAFSQFRKSNSIWACERRMKGELWNAHEIEMEMKINFAFGALHKIPRNRRLSTRRHPAHIAIHRINYLLKRQR